MDTQLYETEQEVRTKYKRLTNLLIKRRLTITTMESATSGQIASLITDTEGSSAALKGAFVTYSNEAKIMQGVPEEVIERFSVYSEETALEMARACQKAYRADIGIGVTGTFGNVDPANLSSSMPGQIYFAICVGSEGKSYHASLDKGLSRFSCKLAAADLVCTQLLRILGVSE